MRLPLLLLAGGLAVLARPAGGQFASENEPSVLFDGGATAVREGSGDGVRADGGFPMDGRLYPDDEDSRGGGAVEGSGDGQGTPDFVAFTIATLPAADGRAATTRPTERTRPPTPPSTRPSTTAASSSTAATEPATAAEAFVPVRSTPDTTTARLPPQTAAPHFTWPTRAPMTDLPPTGPRDEDEAGGRSQRDLALLVLIIVIAAIALLLLGLVLCCVVRRCTKRRSKPSNGGDPSSAHVHAHNESYMAGGPKSRQHMPLIQNV